MRAAFFLLLALITLFILPCSPQTLPADTSAPAACLLSVHVDGFRNEHGVLGCAVFKSSKGWPEKDAFAERRIAVPITNNQALVTLSQMVPGVYGIAVLHDENANHHLDRNILGMPKEGFGFANNPHVGLLVPSWQDASVKLSPPSTDVYIHLIYK